MTLPWGRVALGADGWISLNENTVNDFNVKYKQTDKQTNRQTKSITFSSCFEVVLVGLQTRLVLLVVNSDIVLIVRGLLKIVQFHERCPVQR